MRSTLFPTFMICIFCSCMSTKGLQIGFAKKQDLRIEANHAEFSSIIDFRVQRLSGSRVRISWHALPGREKPRFEILRRIGKNGNFNSVSLVEADNNLSDTILDYAVTDYNQSRDSSFYTIRQIDENGTRYNSMWRGVPGVND